MEIAAQPEPDAMRPSIAAQIRPHEPDIGIPARFKYACLHPRNRNQKSAQKSPKGRRKFHGADPRMHL
jgi:hypothetical protein